MPETIRDLVQTLLMAIDDLEHVDRTIMGHHDATQRQKMLLVKGDALCEAIRAAQRAARVLWLKRISFPAVECPILRALAEDALTPIMENRDWKPLLLELTALIRAADPVDHASNATPITRRGRLNKAESQALKTSMLAMVVQHPTLKDDMADLSKRIGVGKSTVRRWLNAGNEKYRQSKTATSRHR